MSHSGGSAKAATTSIVIPGQPVRAEPGISRFKGPMLSYHPGMAAERVSGTSLRGAIATKQSRPSPRAIWIASLALAMTAERVRRAWTPCANCPSCQSVASRRALPCRANQNDDPRVPRPQEGRFAIVTDVGSGMRWTRRVVGRTTYRGRRNRVVLAPQGWR